MSQELEQILKSINSVEEQNKTLLTSYENLDKQTKQVMEDLTALKNGGADYGAQLRALQKLQTHLGHERRMAFGDPVQALTRNPEKAALVVAGVARKLGLLESCSKRIQEISKDLDGGNTPGSTYIANAEIDREIFDVLMTYGAYRTLDVRTVGARVSEVRVKTARAGMKFVDEAATIGADAAKGGSKVAVPMKKIGGLISVSNELMDDDITGVATDIVQDFAESYAEKLDHISFAADGTADDLDGGFTGMFYGGTARVAGAGGVSVETLKFEDWLACLANAPAVVLQRQSKWWLHPTMLARSLTLRDLNGRPMFQTAIESPSMGSIGTILGYGVVPVGNAPTTNGINAKIAVFGDPAGQAVRIRRELTIDRSADFSFDTDEITFRAVGRAGTKTRIATAFQVLTTAAA